MRLSEADGRPVISRESAETVGELKHVVVDVGARSISALHVAGGKRSAQLVDWDDVAGFGPDGIVIGNASATHAPRDDHEKAVVAGRLDLDGRLVLDDEGRALGALEDVLFDEGSGRIGAFVAGGAEHDAARLRAIGSYCVILATEPAPPG
jgi:uncharacterized protein YrrD